MDKSRRWKIFWTIVVVFLFGALLFVFCKYPVYWQKKYVNTIAPTMAEPITFGGFTQSGNKPYALLVDGRTDFNGILKFSKHGQSWYAFGDFLWKTHNPENDNSLFYRFRYGSGVAMEKMTETWADSTDTDPSKHTTVMGQVFKKAGCLLQGISLEQDEQRVDTVIIVTDDFFDLADMAVSRYFFSVYDQFKQMCEDYNVAVLSYSVDYVPPDRYGEQVIRPLYFVVISKDPGKVREYCTALMNAKDPDHFAWNEPDLKCRVPGFTAALAEKQQRTYKQIYRDGTKGFLLEKKAEDRTEPIIMRILLGEEGLYGRSSESLFSKPLEKYENAVYWEVSCKIYELDRYGNEHDEIENLVLEPLPDATDLFFIDPETATPESPLLTYTIPAEVLQALDKEGIDRYLCRISIRPLLHQEAQQAMLYWVQGQALDSTLTVEAEEIKAGVKPALDMPDDMNESMEPYDGMKDVENQPVQRIDRSTTKTLWLNRLVNYDNFLFVEHPDDASDAACFQVVLLVK